MRSNSFNIHLQIINIHTKSLALFLKWMKNCLEKSTRAFATFVLTVLYLFVNE